MKNLGLKYLSPEDLTRITNEECKGKPQTVKQVVKRIKRLGLVPVGHVTEWAKYGIKAEPNLYDQN